MEELRTSRIHYTEIARDIYAAVTPAGEFDITDAGMMDNFSNAAFINRGEGLVFDTFFDPAHAQDLREFCIQKSGHAPGYVINSHGHWDHFWGNQVFEEAAVMGHRDMLKDCAEDQRKVPVFRFLHRSKGLQALLSFVMTSAFRKHLPAGKKAKFLVRMGENDFDLSDVKPQIPTVLIEENRVLNLDGTEVQLIHLGGVHSSSDLVAWIPSEKVLFAGDIFADCSLPMSLEGCRKWIGVMDYILDELQPEVIVPGHGEVYHRDRAESQRAYFRALLSQIEERYTPGMKPEELIAKMDMEKYIDHRPRLAWIMAVKTMIKEIK